MATETADFTQDNIFQKEFGKKTVFLDRNIISPHYTPNQLPFREKQLQEMTSALAVAFNGKKPNNLFIYGKTGTGKTSSTKFVIAQLNDFAEKNHAKILTCYINCRTHNSKYKVLTKALKDFSPNETFIGFSASFVYEKFLEQASKNSSHIILAMDEIDKVKDLDELIYSLTRGNDEVQSGSISMIGISNNLMFKEKLDPRTKSALCEQEMVFPPYDAEELKAILEQRIKQAFRKGTVDESATSLASAIAAKETGDARTAIMLMQRAGELADKNGLDKVTDEEVKKAKSKVEEEIIINMVSTLPEQQQLVLYAIAALTVEKKGLRTISGEDEGVLFSGEIYDEYKRIAKKARETTVTTRWFREYISELEMFGLILTTTSGKGIRGQTRLIKLGSDAGKIKEAIEKEIFK